MAKGGGGASGKRQPSDMQHGMRLLAVCCVLGTYQRNCSPTWLPARGHCCNSIVI